MTERPREWRMRQFAFWFLSHQRMRRRASLQKNRPRNRGCSRELDGGAPCLRAYAHRQARIGRRRRY